MDKLYKKIYNQFIDLVNGKIDKVIVTPAEILALDYFDGNFNNYADILRKNFKNKLVQEIDVLTGNYIYKRK